MYLVSDDVHSQLHNGEYTKVLEFVLLKLKELENKQEAIDVLIKSLQDMKEE